MTEYRLEKAYMVDWQRRRILNLTAGPNPSRCHHGELLTIWCRACGDDLDTLAADLLP